MVWCWQQHPDHRPSASEIISTAQSDQFLRLLNGIRISRGQVSQRDEVTLVHICCTSDRAMCTFRLILYLFMCYFSICELFIGVGI